MIDKKEDRTTFIGGSEVSTIFGTSRFKKPFELALEKAGIIENKFTGNIYSESGNILEPIIQDIFSIKNMDDKSYKKGNFICHIDGISVRKNLVEIKVSSSTFKKIEKDAYLQIQTYLDVCGFDKCELIAFSRKDNEKFNSIFKKIQNKYNLNWNTNFEDTEFEEEIKKELKKDILDYDIDFFEIDTKIIEKDEELIKEIHEKCNVFWKFVEDLKTDIFFDVDDVEEYKEKEKELNELLEIIK